MKFKLDKEIIQETATKIEKILNAKSAIPILAGVLVQAKSDCILFTASDGTESIIHRIPVEDDIATVETEGSTILTKDCLDVARKLKETISFETIAHKVIVSQESSKTNLEFSVMDADEYPKITVEATATPIVFSGKDFSDVINKTSFAASTSEIRPILQGIHMSLSPNGNVMSATDSHRLGKVVSGAYQDEIKLTIPAKILKSALKSFDLSKDVIVVPSECQIAIANGNTIFYSRLLEGNYPDTSRLIPNDFEMKLVLSRKEFLDAIDILSVMTKNGVIKLKMDGLFVEVAATGETSKGSMQIAFESYDGDSEFEIAFSAKYVADALKSIDASSVTIGFNGNMKPFVIQPVAEERDELQLILPVRVTN